MLYLGDNCMDKNDPKWCQDMQMNWNRCSDEPFFAYYVCRKTCGNCNMRNTPAKKQKDERKKGKVFQLQLSLLLNKMYSKPLRMPHKPKSNFGILFKFPYAVFKTNFK